MLSEKVKPSNLNAEAERSHKLLDKEIRDMLSAITHRVSDPQRSGSGPHQEDDGENGVRIITLAGSNTGATMRSEVDDKLSPDAMSFGEDEALGTYVNSNFQAVNNSIMLGSSYNANDPGVHMEISDAFEHDERKQKKRGKKKEKEKEKEKEHLKSGRYAQHSD